MASQKCRDRRRTRDAESLHVIDNDFTQVVERFLGLDRFSYDAHTGLLAYGVDGARFRELSRIAHKVPDDRAVDLQKIDRESREIGKRYLGAAKVVNAEAAARGSQRGNEAPHAVVVFDRVRFADLEAQRARRKIRTLELLAHKAGEVG